MKISGFRTVLLAGTLTSASAQVSVEVTLDQQQFLEGESLPAAVRVTNRSGQTLHLGDEAEWLTFSVESKDGQVVSKLGEVPVAGEFTLDSSKVAIKRVNLAPYFTLTHRGRYAIVASVHVKDWAQDMTSPPKSFDIIEGAKMWEQEVGVPQSSGSGAPEVRKYILQQANYIKGQLRLYLRVTDAYGRAIRVLPIGPMVSFGHPEPPQIDNLSNLHVLYQTGPFSFSYTVFNPDGELVTRQVYEFSGNTRPRLSATDDGAVVIKGGTRRITPNDVPAPKDDDEDTSPTTPTTPVSESVTKTAPPDTAPSKPK
ncbi:MAG TPA: hypothetical protein VL361_05080 [Candidatus Limnocylindrales bacterium]|nr:hypothetical protein [Candidatus Limnocylindrales bacterium]